MPPKPDRKRNRELAQRAADLYQQGLGERAVAERMGVSKSQARRYLDGARVKRRSVGRPRRAAPPSESR